MIITEDLRGGKVIVKMLDDNGYTTPTLYQNFTKGAVLNPYDRTICGVGYIGEGKYRRDIKQSKYRKMMHHSWDNMIRRCYDESTRWKYPAYKDCYVADIWHNYQNFATWYDENYYDCGGGYMHIDKDLLVKGNKVYSPDTCLILPQRINMIFMTKTKNRDIDLPNAIYRCKTGFQASYNGNSLGVFKTIEDAIIAHDAEMRIHIKNITNEYGNKLPDKVRQTLLSW